MTFLIETVSYVLVFKSILRIRLDPAWTTIEPPRILKPPLAPHGPIGSPLAPARTPLGSPGATLGSPRGIPIEPQFELPSGPSSYPSRDYLGPLGNLRTPLKRSPSGPTLGSNPGPISGPPSEPHSVPPSGLHSEPPSEPLQDHSRPSYFFTP